MTVNPCQLSAMRGEVHTLKNSILHKLVSRTLSLCLISMHSNIISFSGKILAVKAAERDEIQVGTTLMLVGAIQAIIFTFPVCVFCVHYGLSLGQALKNQFFVVKLGTIFILWYSISSGLVLFTVFTYYALGYSLVISKSIAALTKK